MLDYFAILHSKQIVERSWSGRRDLPPTAQVQSFRQPEATGEMQLPSLICHAAIRSLN